MINRFIDNIGMPVGKAKFEDTSIDGYAFYGWARHLMGKNTKDMERIMEGLVYGLNGNYNIRGVDIPANATYVYSCFPAFMFYKAIGRDDKVDDIIRTLDDIGRYENGMMRYCSTEIDYCVPNVTPLAALMYSLVERYDDAVELTNAIRENQDDDGNWFYSSPSDGVLYGKEDSMHLCMMIYALRELKANDVADRAMKDVVVRNSLNIQGGSIGWGFPWLMLVTANIQDYKKLHSEAKDRTVDLLRNKLANFRTRTMSVWALSMLENGYGENNTL